MAGRRFAICVGLTNYTHWGKLNYAARDARAVHQILADPARGGFTSTLLVNDDSSDATPELVVPAAAPEQSLKKVRDVIFNLLQLEDNPLQADDTVVLYFAGHAELTSADKLLLIMPASEKVNKEPKLDTILSLSSILEAIEHCGVGNVVILLDACHAGAATAPVSWPQGRKNLFILGAVQTEQEAIGSERLGGGHGLFTYHLLAALNNKNLADKDGWTTIGRIDDYIKAHLPLANQMQSVLRSSQTIRLVRGPQTLDTSGALTGEVEQKLLNSDNQPITQPEKTRSLSDLSFKEKAALADKLLECRSLKARDDRANVIVELETSMNISIQYSAISDSRKDLLFIITACANYKNVWSKFLEIVQVNERDSIPWKELCAYLEENKLLPKL